MKVLIEVFLNNGRKITKLTEAKSIREITRNVTGGNYVFWGDNDKIAEVILWPNIERIRYSSAGDNKDEQSD